MLKIIAVFQQSFFLLKVRVFSKHKVWCPSNSETDQKLLFESALSKSTVRNIRYIDMDSTRLKTQLLFVPSGITLKQDQRTV